VTGGYVSILHMARYPWKSHTVGSAAFRMLQIHPDSEEKTLSIMGMWSVPGAGTPPGATEVAVVSGYHIPITARVTARVGLEYGAETERDHCYICTDQYRECIGFATPRCGHDICVTCLRKLGFHRCPCCRYTCPMCRDDMKDGVLLVSCSPADMWRVHEGSPESLLADRVAQALALQGVRGQRVVGIFQRRGEGEGLLSLLRQRLAGRVVTRHFSEWTRHLPRKSLAIAVKGFFSMPVRKAAGEGSEAAEVAEDTTLVLSFDLVVPKKRGVLAESPVPLVAGGAPLFAVIALLNGVIPAERFEHVAGPDTKVLRFIFQN